MKLREWSHKILWFSMGVVSIGLLMFISTAYSKRTEAGSAVKPVQTLEQRVSSLEGRVSGIEARENERAKQETQRERRRDP